MRYDTGPCALCPITRFICFWGELHPYATWRRVVVLLCSLLGVGGIGTLFWYFATREDAWSVWVFGAPFFLFVALAWWVQPGAVIHALCGCMAMSNMDVGPQGARVVGSRSMQKYQGSCHCGAVRFEIETDFPELTMCDCSICLARNRLPSISFTRRLLVTTSVKRAASIRSTASVSRPTVLASTFFACMDSSQRASLCVKLSAQQ
jgi:hypothetical protein